MNIFTSDREKRLWLWVLAVVVAIYSTLGPTGMLVGYLREHNLLRASVALVLLLVVGTIVWKYLKRRPSRGEIGVMLGVAAVYLIAWIRIESWEERTHLIEYALVAVLIYQALSERLSHGRRVPALAGPPGEPCPPHAAIPSRTASKTNILSVFIVTSHRPTVGYHTGLGLEAVVPECNVAIPQTLNQRRVSGEAETRNKDVLAANSLELRRRAIHPGLKFPPP